MEDVEGSSVARDLFEGLMNENAAGEVVPGVATGFEMSDDGLTYTFTLRDDAKWSNGAPVIASGFVNGLRRAANPENASPYAWYIEVMGVQNASEVIAGDMPLDALGVSAPDDKTVVYTIDTPRPYFPQMLTFPTTFPVNLAAVEAAGDNYTDPANFVSNGAYVLAEYVPGEKLTRVRNDMYWNNEDTIIDEVSALIINDSNQALTRFLAGEIDFVMDVPAGQFPRLVAENTPFYGYVMCEMTEKVKEWLEEEKNFTPMPDGGGWFGWFGNINLYMEVLSWDKVLRDAEMRNSVFFHKLGID